MHLFAFKVGNQMHCVNFPLLSAVLSEKQVEFRRVAVPLTIAGCSLLVSILSFVVACIALAAKH